MTNSLSKNLIYQRKLKGLTQKELSDRTNITVRTIQRIEKGETEPHLQTVKLLAVAMDIDVDTLLPLNNPREEDIQKKWLLLLHATPFLGSVIPLFNILAPVFIWIHKREDNKIYDIHGRKVLNFQLTMTLVFLFALSGMMFIGHLIMQGTPLMIFLFFGVLIYTFIVMCVNIYLVIKDRKCYYPLSIPFLSIKRKAKNKMATIVLIVSSFFFSCSSHAQTVSRLDGSQITVDSLDRKIKQLMTDAKVTGMAITIFNDGKSVYSKAHGYRNKKESLILTDSSNIYGASLSKAVFSVIAMKLVEEGFIDLDTPLESYLDKKIYEYVPQTRWHDDYSNLKNDTLYHKITARMCLAHTSGFPNWRFFLPDQKLKVTQEPGEGYLYSGEGMVYLQVVLEKLTGKGFEELASEIIFEPLQMTNSSYEFKPSFEKSMAYGHNKDEQPYQKDKDNEPRAPSTLETTLEDYTKFMTAVFQRKLISENSWQEIFKPQVRIRTLKQFGPLSKQTGSYNDDIKLSYGLGWGIFFTPYGKAAFKEGHGSGFIHHSVIFPEAGKGILIMTNSENGNSIFKELLEATLKDTYTPWEWENYIPFEQKASN
ncbi:serine hydrolase [Mangrovivirga cuniculi]|uniref:XRE family transcriptional regulator n=1 Tax=Mangrovivirga cuniculi TaxID=2715131 RepID=A0A4D7JR59_9BACT|nr:serine hydrolase [Mangrovivirga cuniculi]QCK17147.1 XRE family transcriptional regulator [Mangrovivirga cuniculi]